MQTTIIGIGAASVNLNEYLSMNVLNAYTADILPMQTVFNKTPATITANDYDTIMNQIAALKTLAQNGVADVSSTSPDGTVTYQSFMNQDMVGYLNDIMRTLSFVNIPPAPGTAPLTDAQKISAINAWQNLPNVGVQLGLPSYGIDVGGALSGALALKTNATQFTVQEPNSTGGTTNLLVQAFPTRSLQSALELDYVNYGNQLISTNLSGLQSALSVTQQVLLTLDNVQNFLNQITVTPNTGFSFPPVNDAEIPSTLIPKLAAIDGNINSWWLIDTANARAQVVAGTYATMASAMAHQSGVANIINQDKGNTSNDHTYFYQFYKVISSAYFQQIFPSAAPAINAASNLITLKGDLNADLTRVLAANPSAGINVQGSLAQTIYKVVQDISATFSGISMVNNPHLQSALLSAVKIYIFDSQNISVSTLAARSLPTLPFQTDLTNATTTAETLEENQRESVKRYIFIFQQFYKTTAAILTQLEQMLYMIAQNIDSK